MPRTPREIRSEHQGTTAAKPRATRRKSTTAKPSSAADGALAPSTPASLAQPRPQTYAGIQEALSIQQRLAASDGAVAPDPDSLMPQDYRTASSALSGLDGGVAESALKQIERQGHEADVITANLGLAEKLEALKSRIAKMAGAKVRTATESEKISTELVKHDSQVERSRAAQVQLLNQKIETEGLATAADYLRQQRDLRLRLEQIKVTELEAKISRRLASSDAYLEPSPHQEL